MKKNILALLVTLVSLNLNAGALSFNQTGDGFPMVGEISISIAPSYYNSCIVSIHAKGFSDMAMDGGAYGIVPTMDAFKEHQDTLMDIIEETNMDKVENISQIFAQLKKYFIKDKKFKVQQNTEIKLKERDLRMEYKAVLEKEIAIAEATSFGDTAKGDAPSPESFTYKMMKNLCKRTKMAESTLGASARQKYIEASSKKAKKNVSKRQSVTSLKSEKIKNIDKHYDLFCTNDEFEADLCKFPSALPNGDLQADLFLYPEGFNEENATVSDYDTRYTYNETEALAADGFIGNVVGLLPVEPPTPSELKDPKKAGFVSLYNQLASSMNMSSFIFERAYQKRLPKNKTGLRMSELEILNYMVEDLNSIENKAISGQAKANGFEMLYQSTAALKTKLDMEKLVQKERLKLLEATVLSLNENSAKMLNYLKSKK
jgi:hypothetical protein